MARSTERSSQPTRAAAMAADDEMALGEQLEYEAIVAARGRHTLWVVTPAGVRLAAAHGGPVRRSRALDEGPSQPRT